MIIKSRDASQSVLKCHKCFWNIGERLVRLCSLHEAVENLRQAIDELLCDDQWDAANDCPYGCGRVHDGLICDPYDRAAAERGVQLPG